MSSKERIIWQNQISNQNILANALQYVNQPISPKFTQRQKLNALMDVDLKLFNKDVKLGRSSEAIFQIFSLGLLNQFRGHYRQPLYVPDPH